MKRILIADHDRESLSSLYNTLHEYCDFQGDITTCIDAQEALHEAYRRYYDICFFSVSLKGVDIAAAVRQIMEVFPETAIVYTRVRNSTAPSLDHAPYVVDKPFRCTEVEKVMKIILHGSADLFRTQSAEGFDYVGKRRFRRRALEKVITFYLKDENLMEYKGGALDVCHAGIGLETYYPLERGQILFFSRGVAHKVGIVAWSLRKSDNHYRAGIKFIQ
jgi:two-component SAPR family response regulator